MRRLKQAAGGQGITVVKRKIVDLNTVKEVRQPLSQEFRKELVDAFREEVLLLSRLMGRDLSHWV
jgi:hypothetical protein